MDPRSNDGTTLLFLSHRGPSRAHTQVETLDRTARHPHAERPAPLREESVMSSLAFDQQGNLFTFHRRAKKLLVGHFRNPARAAPAARCGSAVILDGLARQRGSGQRATRGPDRFSGSYVTPKSTGVFSAAPFCRPVRSRGDRIEPQRQAATGARNTGSVHDGTSGVTTTDSPSTECLDRHAAHPPQWHVPRITGPISHDRRSRPHSLVGALERPAQPKEQLVCV